MRKQYNSLDLFKFIFAIAVVMIHTNIFNGISKSLNWYFLNVFCNMAVPFYFITSGFLLFEKVKNDEKNGKISIKKYVLHILKMYLIWGIIWIPFYVLDFIRAKHFDIYDLLSYAKAFIITGRAGVALWYLLALSFGVVVVGVLRKKLNSTAILFIGADFYLFGVLLTMPYATLPKNLTDICIFLSDGADCGIFCGFLYVSIGNWIAEKELKYRFCVHFPLLIVTFVVMFVEAIFIRRYYNFTSEFNSIMMPFVGFLLFVNILNIKLEDRAVFKVLRDYSTLIYLSHCLIIKTLVNLFALVDLNYTNMIMFFVTLILSVFFAIVVRFFAKTKQIGFFKLLY